MNVLRILLITFIMASTLDVVAQNQSDGRYFSFRLKPHEDLKQQINKFAQENKIKAGAIVSCAGSLEQYHIRFANQEKGSQQHGHFEIVSLSGTFSDTSAHIHISVSDEKGQTKGGHLLDGNLVYTTIELVVIDLIDLQFTRETDSTYGYQELVIKKRNP